MIAKNMDLRLYAKEHGVSMWEVATKMGLSENTLYRRLRERQTDAFKNDFKKAVDYLAKKVD